MGQLGSTLDILPTIAELVGFEMPQNVTLDGVSMMPWLFGDGKGRSAREMNVFWPKDPDPTKEWTQSVHALRKGQWKVHWMVGGSHCQNDYADTDCRDNATEHLLATPLLFNLYHDIGEHYAVDVTEMYYEQIVKELNESVRVILQSEGLWAQSQIMLGSNDSYAPCCACDTTYADWPQCCACNKINATWPLFKY